MHFAHRQLLKQTDLG